VFHKAFKTDTDNELGRFLESFIIVKEKTKLNEPSSYMKFSKRKKVSSVISLSPSDN